MTDIEQAHHCAGCTGTDAIGRPCRGRFYPEVASDAAVGRAVDRLLQAMRDPDAWALIALRADGSADVECHFGTTWDRSGDTLPAAIAAALGEDDE